MYIIQKNYTGGNGRGTLEYNLENSETTHEVPAKQWDPYEDKDKYLSSVPKQEENTESTSLELNESAKSSDNILVEPEKENSAKVSSKPENKTVTSSTKVTEKSSEVFHPESDLISETPEEVSAGLKGKAGLVGAGVAALGAGGYAAFKAWKKRKARKEAIDNEINSFYNTKD